MRPPSKCPKCGHEIRTRHNVPVIGWLVLRGKCFDCSNPISPRYPLVEALTGALFAAVTLDVHQLHWALPAYLYFVAIGVALSMIDFDHQRLPDKIVLPSYPVIAALLTVGAAVNHDWGALARAGIGAAALLRVLLRRRVRLPGLAWGSATSSCRAFSAAYLPICPGEHWSLAHSAGSCSARSGASS